MSVTVRDGKSAILATGITENGKRSTDEFSQVKCVFSFQIDRFFQFSHLLCQNNL
ncbi:hypothetical protein GXM_06550 [Nostoc sphaeroides CCNUC1]|uniref:Uncharacterized protein n=1 Tax=Nostoc sphaeroides CCNUC1 TaxID=2653204 RepID=A0A5P8WA49_9NOSO|nr:hypothetical protein GXM_06550 [Nostoc sphaeroides CCNUC1]